MTKEEYQKTLIRIWDSVRRKDSDFKGNLDCNDVKCSDCPMLNKICKNGPSHIYSHIYKIWVNTPSDVYDVIEFVEKWAKEHPIETNGSRFLKNYPKAVVYNYNSNDGFVYLGLDCSKPFVVDGENSTKFPIRWWESEVDDAVNN